MAARKRGETSRRVTDVQRREKMKCRSQTSLEVSLCYHWLGARPFLMAVTPLLFTPGRKLKLFPKHENCFVILQPVDWMILLKG